MTGLIRAFDWYKKWTEYFFPNIDGQDPIAIDNAPIVEELKRCLEQYKILERVLNKDEEGLATSTVLLSYHHWASVDLMPSAILASYLP